IDLKAEKQAKGSITRINGLKDPLMAVASAAAFFFNHIAYVKLCVNIGKKVCSHCILNVE
ncbi:MAG: hypothetical protein ABS920_13895, partial [Sporosarcina sp.]